MLDALDSGDDAKFAEELGDLLLQVLFHAQIASEENRFTISDVIREIHEKMIRRHPHVFGTTRAKTAADVLRNWEMIKREEQLAKQAGKEVQEANESKEAKDNTRAHAQPGASKLGVPHSVVGRASYLARHSSLVTRQSESFTSSTSSTFLTSALDGVARTLPALLEAFQLTRKAARIGFDWENIDGIFDKLNEETTELRRELTRREVTEIKEVKERELDALPSQSSTPLTSSASLTSAVESELGDLLFVLVNLARFLHIDPEIALKKTNAKFTHRFHAMERLAHEHGTTLAQVPRLQLEALWDEAKLLERRVNSRSRGSTGVK